MSALTVTERNCAGRTANGAPPTMLAGKRVGTNRVPTDVSCPRYPSQGLALGGWIPALGGNTAGNTAGNKVGTHRVLAWHLVSAHVTSRSAALQEISDEDWRCARLGLPTTEPKVWGSNPYGRAHRRGTTAPNPGQRSNLRAPGGNEVGTGLRRFVGGQACPDRARAWRDRASVHAPVALPGAPAWPGRVLLDEAAPSHGSFVAG
jgi:hypothetical protein